jgi:hypothetical protein
MVSQICQRAIEQVVEIEEIKLKEIPVMEKGSSACALKSSIRGGVEAKRCS